jgi:putative effector of murein hydrolase LrgA (UPF0299 family)
MSAWKRWQDWAIVVLGIVLFITPLTVPFISGGTATAAAAYTAYVMGLLFVGAGVYVLANPVKLAAEWIEIVLGVLLIASPFVIGFSGVVVVAYTAWIIGVLAILLAGSVLLMQGRRPAMAH